MFHRIGKLSAIITIVVAVVLAAACGKFGKNDVEEANKLIQDANAKLKQVDQITADNDKNIRDLNEADKSTDRDKVTRVKSLLDTLIKAIDTGLKLGDEIATDFEQASKKNLDPKQKEYLDLVVQSVRKRIEAFKERREAAKVMRDYYDTGDTKKFNAARDEFGRRSEAYKKLKDQSEDLARKAAQIMAENSTIIKPQ